MKCSNKKNIIALLSNGWHKNRYLKSTAIVNNIQMLTYPRSKLKLFCWVLDRFRFTLLFVWIFFAPESRRICGFEHCCACEMFMKQLLLFISLIGDW